MYAWGLHTVVAGELFGHDCCVDWLLRKCRLGDMSNQEFLEVAACWVSLSALVSSVLDKSAY